MASDPEQYEVQLDKLIGLFDGACSHDRLDEITHLIESDTDLCAFYLEYVEMHVLLRRRFGVDRTPSIEDEDPFTWQVGFDAGLLADLVADERKQHHTRVLDEAEMRALALHRSPESARERGHGPILAGRSSLPSTREIVIPKSVFYGTLLAASLALLALVWPAFLSPHDTEPLTATPAPPTQPDVVTPADIEPPAAPAPPVVARVMDQIDTRWASAHSNGFNPGDQVVLESGLARLRFAEGAEVVLEGPAHIEIVSERSVYLHEGRLVGSCRTSTSRGFTVNTPVGRLIDIGTEFGLSFSASSGQMITQVFEGSVLLAAVHADGFVDASREVFASEAAEVDRARQLRPVGPDELPVVFTRDVSKRIDLIDVVAGGDGTGSGWNHGIDTRTGQWFASMPTSTRWDDYIFKSDGQYHASAGSPFVDGVFIPDDRSGNTQIDSAGTTTDVLPATSGFSYGGIWAGGTVPNHIGPDAVEFSKQWGLIDYAQRERGLLSLHSNQGITFDLQALGQAAGGLVPHAFRASMKMATQKPGRQVDVFIFVDGELLFEKRGLGSLGIEQVLDLPLPADARFLTLVTTEGNDGRWSDWLFYGEPEIAFITDTQDFQPSQKAE